MIEYDNPRAIRVYTDGSCYPNPNGHGGWAFRAESDKGFAERWGYQVDTTNNVMEIRAIVRALQFIPAHEKATRPLFLFVDSSYAINALTIWHHGWSRQDWRTSNGNQVRNKRDIVAGVELIKHHRKFRHLEFVKIKGHTGIEGNERVDDLAGMARKTQGKDLKWLGKGWMNDRDIRTSP